MEIQPGFGGWTWFVELFRPEMTAPVSYSIASGVVRLLVEGDWFLGVVIGTFSVLFPIFKFVAFYLANEQHMRGRETFGWLAAASAISKYSMLDVFVISLLVLTLKSMPGNTEIRIGWAVYPFTVAVLMSVWLGLEVERTGRHSPGTK